MAEDRLRITPGSSAHEGGCNFCNAHTTEHGEITHDIFSVRAAKGGGLVARFCLSCAKEFRITTKFYADRAKLKGR
jgi:hypothetical protein